MPPVLAILGLDEVDEALYDHLVRHPHVDAASLREGTGLPAGRLASALRRLQQQGLIDHSGTRPRRYLASPPEASLEPLLRRRERELQQARSAAARLNEQYRDTVRTDDPRELVEIISGRSQVARRYGQLQRSAQREVRMLDRPPYLSDPYAGNPIELDLLANDISYRTIYDAAALRLPARKQVINTWVTAGEQARLARSLPMKLCLVDDRAALLPLQASGAGELDAAIAVHRSALLDALGSLFETLWQQAAPWPTANTEADRDHRQLLALLNAGLTEQAIAHHLSLSRSTIDRRLRDLLTALGAQTRFQAGVQAAARGWLQT